MNYHKKYIKYKYKYYNLENIKGGTSFQENLDLFNETYKPTISLDEILSADFLLGTIDNLFEKNQTLNQSIFYLNKLHFFHKRSLDIILIYEDLNMKNQDNSEYTKIDINEMNLYIREIYDKLQHEILILFKNITSLHASTHTIMIIILKYYNICINHIMRYINNLETNFIYSNIDWFNFNYPTSFDKQIKLYILREYIIGIILCFANIIYDIRIYISDKTNNLPTEFNFKISGSAELLSDIDINIHAQYNSAIAMSIVENLAELITWFNHTKWRVDFYGDIIYIYSLKEQTQIKQYIKINNDDKTLLKKLLKYVYIGCLKINTCKSSRDKIINIIKLIMETLLTTEELLIIFEAGDKLDKIYSKYLNEEHSYRIERVKKFDEVKDLEKINNFNLEKKFKFKFREKYYKWLSKVDQDCINYKNNSNDINALEIYENMAHANVYREENYMLIGTVINIVNCTQDKSTDPTDTLCNLTYYTYILSIIEQFGFMIHYIFKLNIIGYACVEADICNLQANKYFERILNILIKILKMPELNNITNQPEYTLLMTTINKCKETSEFITKIKKERSSQSNKTKDCDKHSDFKILESFDNIMELFNKIMKSKLVSL